MKKAIYFVFFILCTLLFSSCTLKSNELVWVVPASYAPSEYVVKSLNEALNGENFDYTVKFLGIPYNKTTSYTEQVKQLINSGVKIDIVFSGSPNSTEYDVFNSSYYRFIVDGILTSLNEYTDSEYGKRLMKAFPSEHWDAMKVDGQIYGINGALTTLSTDNILLVNQNYGSSSWNTNRVYSLNDVFNIVKNEIIPSDISLIVTFPQRMSYCYFRNITQVTDCLYIKDDEIIFALEDNEYVEFLKQCKNMLDNGVLVNGDETDNECYSSLEDCVGGFELSNTFNNSRARKPYLMIPLENESYIRFSNIGTGICTSSQNKEKAFSLLSLCFTNQKLNNLLVFGKENVDYILKDGIPINTNRYENFRVYAFGNRLICYPLYFETSKKLSNYIDTYKNAITLSSFGFMFNDSTVKEYVVNTNLIYNEFLEIIADKETKVSDIDDIVKRYIEAMDIYGLKIVTTELQHQYYHFIEDK